MFGSSDRGFTLIELMVVIAVIGILASIALVSLTGVQKSARDAQRKSDLGNIRTALERYNVDNGFYPNPGWGWRSQCPAWGGFTASQVIPGLVSQYMGSFPTDPSMNTSSNTCCYLYLSNGTDYKVLDHNCPESNYTATDPFYDPVRPTWAWQISTPGGRGW